jgi:REP element-mobilizing transposase RayT
MVAAYHLIWTIYGVWLPNDPRGSQSDEIRSTFLEELGELHHGRKKAQPCSAIIRKFYQEAAAKLKHDTVPLSAEEIRLVADAFSATIETRRYTCYGCAIMPDHVHMLIRKHKDRAEEMIAFLQDDSWQRLLDEKRRPSDHPVWARSGWRVFLDTCDDIERTVRYIRGNPVKAKMQEQAWEFVYAYDGWLPGGRMKKR